MLCNKCSDLKQHTFIISNFCGSRVWVFDGVFCLGLMWLQSRHQLGLQPLLRLNWRRMHFCGQNSVPYSDRSFIFWLAVRWQLPSAPKSDSQFLATWASQRNSHNTAAHIFKARKDRQDSSKRCAMILCTSCHLCFILLARKQVIGHTYTQGEKIHNGMKAITYSNDSQTDVLTRSTGKRNNSDLELLHLLN